MVGHRLHIASVNGRTEIIKILLDNDSVDPWYVHLNNRISLCMCSWSNISCRNFPEKNYDNSIYTLQDRIVKELLSLVLVKIKINIAKL